LTNLVELNVRYNKMITDINHLINLKILYANGESGIDTIGISKLTNITKLSISCNNKITNINHLTNLQILYANKCNVSNDDIQQLTNLVELHAMSKKITNINHLVNLRILYASQNRYQGFSGIDDCGLVRLTNLVELYVD